MNEDTGVNENQQDVKNLFDRLRSCFVEADQDLSTTAGVSEGEIFEMFKPSKKNEDKELDGSNLDRAIPTNKEAMQA
ncbi:hypothetical protein HZS_6884 [Henneguya salminicola]|nr:hypothetical protein HZS_6884 [Henneguya salminicola]